MDALMKEYAKRWYLFVVCIVLIFPAIIAGLATIFAIWGFRIMGSYGVMAYIALMLVMGAVSTLPIQILHVFLYKKGFPKLLLAGGSLVWIVIFSQICGTVLERM